MLDDAWVIETLGDTTSDWLTEKLLDIGWELPDGERDRVTDGDGSTEVDGDRVTGTLVDGDR